MHRNDTGENVFDLGNGNEANQKIYKSAVEGLLPICKDSYSFLSNRFHDIDVERRNILLEAFLHKASTLRPSQKTIELRSNQSPLRYHPELEYLTFTSGVLEGLHSTQSVKIPAEIGRIGTYTGNSENTFMVDMLNTTPITEDGHLSIQPTLMHLEGMQAKLRGFFGRQAPAIFGPPEKTLRTSHDIFKQVRIMPDKTIQWPPILTEDEAIKKKLESITCTAISPCVYTPGFLILSSDISPIHLQHSFVHETKSSTILAHYFGDTLLQKIAAAHSTDIIDYERIPSMLNGLRENARMSPYIKCALPFSARTQSREQFVL